MKLQTYHLFTVLVIILSSFSAPASAAIYSFLFKDVINSNGAGNINLYSPRSSKTTVDGAILEAFRRDNNGNLVFAVDVNEASDGSENTDSQGLAINSLTLRVTVDGIEYSFTDYYTRTQTLLTAAGGVDRSLYYTLIGVGGSALISPNMDSELTGTSIDSTLWIPVDIDLSGVTSAQLTVELLHSAVELGDPEAFYDFSNGFEEIALLTAEDVAYLESLARGLAFAPMVIQEGTQDSLVWSFYPSSGAYYVAAFEDLFPDRGDYDFNDLTVAYQLEVGSDAIGNVSVIQGNGYLITRGAEYDHNFYLGIELPGTVSGSASISFFEMGQTTPATGYPKLQDFTGRVDLLLAENIASRFYDNGSTYVNTFEGQTVVKGPKFEFELLLDTPVTLDLGTQAPFDPYLYVHDTNYEIHTESHPPAMSSSSNQAGGSAQFKDENGYPFAMILNENWLPPLAGVDMGLAYPELVDHVLSNGQTNTGWHASPVSDKVKPVPFLDWEW